MTSITSMFSTLSLAVAHALAPHTPPPPPTEMGGDEDYGFVISGTPGISHPSLLTRNERNGYVYCSVDGCESKCCLSKDEFDLLESRFQSAMPLVAVCPWHSADNEYEHLHLITLPQK